MDEIGAAHAGDIRLGLIGCGFVADYYMATAKRHTNVRIARAYDHRPAHAQRFEAHWGVPTVTTEAAFYDGLTVDAVLNLTNPDQHFAVSRTALERGYSVYSEKPLAMTIQHVDALRSLAHSRGLSLASAPCNHLSEAFAAVKHGLETGHIGRPLLAYAEMDDNLLAKSPYQTWINPSGAPWPYEDEFAVGCTLEHAGYCLTWLIALFGGVAEVHAFGSLAYPGKPIAHGATEAPDLSVACLVFESGMIARLTCSIIAPVDHAMRVFGDAGVLRADSTWDYASPVSYKRWMKIRRKLLLTPWSNRVAIEKGAASRPNTGSSAMDFIRGPIEMVAAAREGRPSRVPLDFCVHFTEVALAIADADGRRAPYRVRSKFESHQALSIAPTPRRSLREAGAVWLGETLLGVIAK